jgi:hypothetical protein
VLLVDAANVVGSRPNGWWRDRPGAAARLVAALRASDLDRPVVVVLEGAARGGVEEGEEAAVEVLHAPGSGDDLLADLAGPDALLVTADRGLRERASKRGADVIGPGWLHERLAAAPARDGRPAP